MTQLTPENTIDHLRGKTWESFFGISPGCAKMGKPVCEKLSNGSYEITWPMTITTKHPVSVRDPNDTSGGHIIPEPFATRIVEQ